MPTVLVVDDALFMRTAVGNMFKEWGYDVHIATNGKEAVDLYPQILPDIVTMDITMPIMSGLDAVKQIVPNYPDAKIIMITALGQQRIIVEALEYGAKDFITKPFDSTQLKMVVDKLLDL
ncbi:response regulator [Ureibacillus acetophenoni]|uniref:Two-component system chemotaxis response regulator CheY n=1 Tax=Ureibacillus acetophenoni TaxID=614649 RepID=A0A285U9G8_9BACL|nr:response regulator [Ureibacillus acetophenoni]SOC37186.1 two-component system chemotaxis response regulator CheY [Ureibacillus acetophenoni]